MRTVMAAVATIAAVVACRHVLGRPFWQDDFLWLYRMEHAPSSWAILWDSAGGHLRLGANVLLLLTAPIAGLDPRGWFVTVVALHVAAVVGLIAVIERWTGRRDLAAAAAAIWATAPIHGATLGWYAAGAPAALATAALVGMLYAITAGATGWAIVAMLVCGVTFGVGLAAALTAPLVAWLLRPADVRLRVRLAAAAGVLVVAYLVTMATAAPTFRDPALEAKVGLRAGLADPARTLGLWLALAVHAGQVLLPFGGVLAAAAAVVAVRRRPRPAIAALLVAGVTYAAIALARVGIGVGATEPRYHYLGSLFCAVLLALAAAALRVPSWVAGLVLAACVVRAATTTLAPFPVDVDAELAALRAELRAAPGDVAVLPNAPFRPAAIALLAPEGAFPGRAAAFVLYHPDGTLDGRRVLFVAESWDAYRAAVAGGGPIARVLVPPGERPP